MKKQRTLLGALAFCSALTLLPGAPALAEEIQVRVGSQADRQQADLPVTGMSQATVRASWGAPVTMEGPVGQPPISQWHYPNFVVYFEGDRVIHAVLKPGR